MWFPSAGRAATTLRRSIVANCVAPAEQALKSGDYKIGQLVLAGAYAATFQSRNRCGRISRPTVFSNVNTAEEYEEIRRQESAVSTHDAVIQDKEQRAQ